MKQWFRSLFVSENGNEAKFLTFYKKDSTKSVLASLICIVAGILLGWLVLLIIALASSDVPDTDAFSALGILLAGPFASGSGNTAFVLGDMLFESAPLIMTGLSIAIAFKTGLFNIGAPGQYLMGAMGAIITALSIPTTPGTAFFVWLFALIVGMAFGMIWGIIPGLFKAFFNVNEVIVCIMTNWIAANIVSWVFKDSQYINVAGGKTAYTLSTLTNGVSTPKLGLDKLFPGSNIDIGIFIAIAIAIGIYILMNKTTLGYELKACGHNKNAAKYAGMNEKRNIMLSMAIAGGLAAIGASLYYLNGGAELAWNTYARLPDTGFNGIPVALLASNNPIGVVFSGMLLRYLDKGGFNLAGFTSFNEYVSDLVVALIIYFAGFSKFIKDLLSRKRKAKEAEAKATAEPAQDAIVAENVTTDSAPADTAEQEEKKASKFSSILQGATAKAKAMLTKVKASLAKNKDVADEPVQAQIEEKEEENK
ncbi:MAG: ABC transporter permease [Clostridia bacterium]|nr:ABC transporter permease [Clostridia bacterium]